MQRFVRLVIALVLVPLSVSGLRAENYPTKPITIVVALAAGGVADVIARAIGQRLTEEWGQPIVVENRGAANTQVGAAYVAKSPPDGYTLLLTPEYTFTVNPFLYRKQSYDPSGAFAPVSGLVTVPLALVINPILPVQNVRELIAWAKANPEKLNYGIPGVGSTSHLSMELFQAKAGVKFNPVSYKGAAPALTDIVAGHIHAMFVSVGLANGPAKAGQLRILGVGNSSRVAQFPDLPTIAETVPEFETTIWFALFAPSGTSPEIVAKLNGAVQRILADPVFDQKYITTNAYQRLSGPPASLSAIIARDSARWSKVIKEANIVIEE